MSGDCGLYLYLQLPILAKASDVFFHAMNWAMGADTEPRILQDDGSFAPLPSGRRALQLPDQTLGLLRELTLAADSYEEYLVEEINLASELPEDLRGELLAAIPQACQAAIKKYKDHLPSYQMLPNSMARLSEPTGVPYARAFINVFFPELAEVSGFSSTAAQDQDCVQCDVEAILDLPSIAIADDDWPRQQFCHERLFQLTIFDKGKKAAAEHVESVVAGLQSTHELEKEAARKAGTEVPMMRRRNKPKETAGDAAAIQKDSISRKSCNTLGLREQCRIVDGKPNNVLSQLLRVAQTCDPAHHLMHYKKEGKVLIIRTILTKNMYHDGS